MSSSPPLEGAPDEKMSTLIFSNLSSPPIAVAGSHSSHTLTPTPSQTLTFPSQHLTSELTSTAPTLASREVQATVELLHIEEGNSTKPYQLTSKERVILIASLLALFNIGLILGAVLLLVGCIQYRARQNRHRPPTTHSPASVATNTTTTTTTTDAGQERVYDTVTRRSELCAHDTRSKEGISMIANCLYGLSVSPARGPGCEGVMGGVGGGGDMRRVGSSEGVKGGVCGGGYMRRAASCEALTRQVPRPGVDSMVYNKLYGSYKTQETRSPAQCSTHMYTDRDTTDSGTYDYVDD